MDCDKVRKLFLEIEFESCCLSCHEDADIGFGDDLWFLAPDGNTYFVCCSIGRGLEDDD